MYLGKRTLKILVKLWRRWPYRATSQIDLEIQGVTPNNELRMRWEASRSKVHSRNNENNKFENSDKIET
jgi:hypothetical protein